MRQFPRQTGGANCGTQYPAKLAGQLAVRSTWAQH